MAWQPYPPVVHCTRPSLAQLVIPVRKRLILSSAKQRTLSASRASGMTSDIPDERTTQPYRTAVLDPMPPTAQPAPEQHPHDFGRKRHLYPRISTTYPGNVFKHVEPPVIVVQNFLSNSECDVMVSAARQGGLHEISYNDAVLLDVNRLWPLAGVPIVGAGPQVVKGLREGTEWVDVVQAGLLSGLCWLGVIAASILVVWRAAEAAIGGQVFTGTKWTTLHASPATAMEASQQFCERAAKLLLTTPDHFEVPCVTRYEVGEQQRQHMDARPVGDSSGQAQQFMSQGGQRLTQVVVYLNSLSPEAGGATAFHHPLLEGLQIQPSKGDALVFFPSFRDGTPDSRLVHSGQVVLAGEKWIINTWQLQFPPGKNVVLE